MKPSISSHQFLDLLQNSSPYYTFDYYSSKIGNRKEICLNAIIIKFVIVQDTFLFKGVYKAFNNVAFNIQNDRYGFFDMAFFDCIQFCYNNLFERILQLHGVQKQRLNTMLHLYT